MEAFLHFIVRVLFLQELSQNATPHASLRGFSEPYN